MKEMICIVCPKGCHLQLDDSDGIRVSGNQCPRGAEYGVAELTNPTRVVTSTVAIQGAIHRRCPVKTDRPLPKGLILDAMKALDGILLQSPVQLGQIVVGDICGTGISFVVTREM